MQVVLKVKGSQYKVEMGKFIYTHRLDYKEGDDIILEDVLLVDDNGKIKIGDPILKGVKVKAKILKHLKGDKVIVFKKKRRKGYRVKNGYRDALTQLKFISIEGIS